MSMSQPQLTPSLPSLTTSTSTPSTSTSTSTSPSSISSSPSISPSDSTSPPPPPLPRRPPPPAPRGLTTSFSTLSASTPTRAPHQEHKNNTTYVMKSLLAGAIAGSVAKTVTAPLDRVKILFQGHNRQYAQFVGSYSGPFRAVAHMWNTEGFRGLYKGHSATLVRIAPYASLNYMCYEQYKRIIIPNDGKHHPFRKILAGSMAGCTSVFFTYPLDYVHSRMTYQVKESRYRGIKHTIGHTLKHEGGIRQLYKGFGATVMGIIPYAGTSFFTYETLKELFHHPSISSTTLAQDGDLRIRYKLICGALAGAAAQTAAYPLDMIRRRQQLHGLATHIPRYKHTMDAFRNIIKNEGWRGLYVGLTINYLKVGPAMAVSFVTYEQMKKWLKIDPQV